MIQELLGGVLEERKMSMSIPGVLLLDPSTASSPATSMSSQSAQPSASSSLTSSAAGEQQQQQQNLRCPRCDSSNTKFCYYNNYNLTQPRHFCKTCRRYWTKGGALRNVPIGGGCRKTKAVPSIVSAGVVGKCSPAAKAKPATTADLLLSRSGLVAGLDRDLVASSILWPSPHSTSHLMALLRSTSVQNPNPNSCSSFNLSARIKDGSMLGEHMPEQATALSSSAHGLSLDPLVQLPLGTSLWRNHSSHYSYNQHSRPQAQPLQQQQQQHSNMLTGHDMISSSGFQDLQHQRLKSSGNYHNEQLQTMASNVGCPRDSPRTSVVTTAAASICSDSVMEPNSLPAADFSYWNQNQALPWTDLPAANGAFP